MPHVLSLEEIEAWTQRIDELLDSGDEVALRAQIEPLRLALADLESAFLKASLLFNRANILAALRGIKAQRETSSRWDWNSAELMEEVRTLRSAAALIASVSCRDDKTDLRFRIWTNLGNLFSYLGRISEALDWWNLSLAFMPEYQMAVGNKGYGLSSYALALFDHGHRHVFMKHAHDLIRVAVEFENSPYPLEPHARLGLAAHLQLIRSLGDWESFELHRGGYSLGRTASERRYREWCLQHRLFVNPLNDIEPTAISAHDCLTFPSLTVTDSVEAPASPAVSGFYSQLKREFASARFMLFQAGEESKRKTPHFSDRGLHLTNTWDYRIHRSWVDKVKMAFTMAYSVLDKLGPFINLHWALGHDPVRIEFRKVWLASNKKGAPLHASFAAAENWPLRGLYWLSKDLYLESMDEGAIDPEAATLLELRHQITHRYLTVHEFPASLGFEGHFAIAGDDLQAKALKMLRLVRAALIYIALAAHSDERKRPSAPILAFDPHNVSDRDL